MTVVRHGIKLVLLAVITVMLILPAHQMTSSPMNAAVALEPSDVPSAFGINSNIASRHPVYETLHVPADTIVDLGATWVREDFQFGRIEPNRGEYDWNWHDHMVDLFTERGISIVGILNGPAPAWARTRQDISGEPNFTPPIAEDFAAFAGAVVSRYKGRISHWQIWNEPDNPEGRYWRPQYNAAEYANLLKQTYTAIKQADPNAQVLSGGSVSPQPAGDYLKELAEHGAWNSFDIISLHPYTDPKSPEAGNIDIAGIGTIRGIAANLGSKPIWVTEFGWSTGPADRTMGQGVPVDSAQQANFLIRGAVLLRSADIDHIFWYTLKDTETKDGHPHNEYGLVKFEATRADFSPQYHKDAYLAFKTMNQQLAGTTNAHRLSLGGELIVFDFENFGTWEIGDQPNGTFTQSGDQFHSGSFSGALSYNFTTPGDDFVVFLARPEIPIPGTPSELGIWIYGDGSGFPLNVWLTDAQGEILQFRLGPIGAPGWQFVRAPLNVEVEAGNIIHNRQNGRVDFPITLTAIVITDDPDSATGSGTIYLDDLTAMTGEEAYHVRFEKSGEEVVDVLWAPRPTTATVPTRSAQGTIVRPWGEASSETPSNGVFNIPIGESPIFLTHIPGTVLPTAPVVEPPTPVPTQPTDPVPPPVTPPVSDPGTAQAPCPPRTPPPERCFPQTGQCISGRLLQYWEDNDGERIFGYPTAPQREEIIEGRAIQAQWFQRNRLELHPQNSCPFDVQLGLLGEQRLYQMGYIWQDHPRSSPTGDAGCQFFEVTGFNVCGEFLTAWRSMGIELDGQAGKSDDESMALFGLPLTDARMEDIEGKQYLVQWFQRARFELHPENDPANRVLFGLLGNEVLEAEQATP